jgi:carbon storage regulator
MLVLSRKIDESILISNNIELIIVDIIGDKVKIGINAPKDVRILRSEIYEKMSKQNVVQKNKF